MFFCGVEQIFVTKISKACTCVLSATFLKETMRFHKQNNVLYLEVVLVQLGPGQYQAGPANTLGANESSACEGVRVNHFCQRSPFAMHYLTGLPKVVAQMEIARVTECVWAIFVYRWLGFNIVVSLASKRFCLQ